MRQEIKTSVFARVAQSVLIGLALTLSLPVVAWTQARPSLVQSVDIQIPVPPALVSISGKRHLVYELHITNFRPVDVALTRVEVLNADGLIRLADLRDSDLNSKLARVGMQTATADKRMIAAGMRAIVFQWLALDDTAAAPTVLQHRVELDVMQRAGIEHVVVEDRPTPVRTDAPVVLGPPLHGGPWVALYAPLLERGHRTSIYTIEGRARIPARFAIDWIRLNEDATHARGDESIVANWYGYGAEVLAVADAVVAEAKDDIDEAASIVASQGPVALENASGNYVTLNLGRGRYAFYEHLKRGSLKVRAGDRVRRGQVIGLLGNSGSSSSGPHLHFHVADANSALAAEGLPYVFRSFEVVGAFDGIGAFAENKRWNAVPASSGGARRLELPAANTVIMFP